jgi:hypothetical protein
MSEDMCHTIEFSDEFMCELEISPKHWLDQKARPRSVKREETIKERIVQRTGGRIQMLEVEVIGDKVVVRGRAPSYYLKQLALQGALDVIGFGSATKIEFNVEVEARPPRSIRRTF